MKNKKGVIGIVGTLLIVLMVISFSSPSNSANDDVGESENPYDEIVYELDNSISQVEKNNDRIKAIDNDVENYRRQLEGMIENYESLNDELRKNLDGLERVSGVIEKTKLDSDDVGEKLNVLREDVTEKDAEFIYENSGIRIDTFFILIFLGANCVVWIFVSEYYKRKLF